MEWRDSFLDLILIPLSLLVPMAYHVWLWRAVRLTPLRTAAGINSATRRLWAISMTKDNEKKAVLVVQSLRNVIMGSTLVATTAILFCTGIAAVLSSTYTIKKPLSDAVFGAHGEYMMALKYVALLLLFLVAFLSHSLAICFLNEASFLINTSPTLLAGGDGAGDDGGRRLLGLPSTRDYMEEALEKGFTLNFVGNRIFFAGVPLLLWIFGPLLAFLSSLVMIPILYNLDVVNVKSHRGGDCGCGCGNGKSSVDKNGAAAAMDCTLV
ncbi:uncharacterized protein [Oryza sativa Japonica Group]|jgi:uncharacterized membrane protein|uniref:Os09g0494600 protein n=8 Tax=Oryza TaxID=4527 RepID=A0A8J8XPN1_ORYSJ|nr:uncharacterized protein LOC4347453 [Oryza sativa Japonica Group]XP_052167246.1 uncharacterized protein LOC127784097 [Oryza glaberrima]EAZ09604.1 hypothetical protein OsI_31888 [Oryza sativa Indica Group]KAB8111145.1 hypothetical protein EE612_048705 [Oryza sativa]EAZ45229.1 hypothetical protein OsJ_29873 [Oryza sativa Japonica Group]KAF2916853.1 hypothetical protein DAI22_09g150600 [Oryza sativa Japonica Group]BAF25465.1 Os09g0494600 [Oryza sativa Japonica Group]|eukprot:NP_001063551.1 Os09g0494600 [Oryza sativa Japonica Group]